MQGISLIVVYPERVAPSEPIELANLIFETLKDNVSGEFFFNNCHIEVVDSLAPVSDRFHAVK